MMRDNQTVTVKNNCLVVDRHGDRLWQQLSSFRIGDDSDQLQYAQRLVLENDWTLGFAEQVLDEYRRFIYLIAVTGKKLTPSDAVDQAWHLHLAYTRSYWVDLCETILGFELHHQPTRGGGEQQAHFKLCYANTLQHYTEIFGEPALRAVWPAAEDRFDSANRFSGVNRNHVWVIPKPRYAMPTLGLVTLLPLIITACTSIEGENPLWFWVKLAIGVLGIYLIAKWINNALGGSRSGGGNGSGCGSGCSSGGCCGGGD